MDAETLRQAVSQAGFGIALLLAFALGQAIPIQLGALAVGWQQNLSELGKFHRVFKIIG